MDIAYAFGQAGGTAAQGGGLFSSPLIPIVLMLGVMWFFLIRPQQKKQKEHQEMIRALKKGDRIITTGGMHGRITGMTETTLTVEIADKVRVKISRGHISGLVQAPPSASSQTKNKSESDKKK